MNSRGCKDGSKLDSTSFDSNVAQHVQSDTVVLAGKPGKEESNASEKVAILKYNNKIIGLSPVHDYIYRGEALRDMCLYDWVARCERTKLPRKSKSNSNENYE